jgi:hypothetical protein
LPTRSEHLHYLPAPVAGSSDDPAEATVWAGREHCKGADVHVIWLEVLVRDRISGLHRAADRARLRQIAKQPGHRGALPAAASAQLLGGHGGRRAPTCRLRAWSRRHRAIASRAAPTRIRDLGLPLLSVRRIDPEQ